MTDFYDRAAALSADAAQALARALLAELEGTDRAARAALSVPETGEAPAARRTRAAEAPGRTVPRRFSAGTDREDTAPAAPSFRNSETPTKGAAAGTAAETDGPRRQARLPEAQGTGDAVPDTAETAEIRARGQEDALEQLSERVRRDARRYNPGFTRY